MLCMGAAIAPVLPAALLFKRRPIVPKPAAPRPERSGAIQYTPCADAAQGEAWTGYTWMDPRPYQGHDDRIIQAKELVDIQSEILRLIQRVKELEEGA